MMLSSKYPALQGPSKLPCLGGKKPQKGLSHPLKKGKGK